MISKGDDALLDATGRQAVHFPRQADGGYAGYHPADDAEALAQLDATIRGGAGHLLVPNTAFWWLEYYPDFARRLTTAGGCVWRDHFCAIFRLRAGSHGRTGRRMTRVRRSTGPRASRRARR